MKKILILILILLLVSGCEAIYTLEISGESFRETLEINNSQPSSWGSGEGSYNYSIRRNAEANIAIDSRNNENLETNERINGIDYYNISLIDTPQTLGVKYEAEFNVDKYPYSALAVTHFNRFRVNHTREKINIFSGIINNAFDTYSGLRNLTVRITTDREVYEHNADEVKDDGLYWYFTKSNSETKEIRINMSESPNENPDLWKMNSKRQFGMNSLIGIYGLIFVGIILASVAIFIKIKNSNR